MSGGSAKESQHLKWAYYQLLLHLPECPLLLALFHTESGLSLGYHGVLVSGNSVGEQFCTSPALLGWVVW